MSARSAVVASDNTVRSAGLAAAKAVEAVTSYIGAREEFRGNKAILDVLLAFQSG